MTRPREAAIAAHQALTRERFGSLLDDQPLRTPVRLVPVAPHVQCPRCEGGGAEAHRPLSRCGGCDGAGRVARARIVDCESCGSDALGSLCGRCEAAS